MKPALRTFWITLVIWLAACGGGGQSSSYVPPTPAPVAARTDLSYCYYGGDSSIVLEVADHVNCHWATGWNAPLWVDAMALELQLARSAGHHEVTLHMPECKALMPGAREVLPPLLRALAATGQLDGWSKIRVYWCDEPNLSMLDRGAYSDATVTEVNAWLRAALATIPQLAAARLGVIYGGDSADTPGWSSYDDIAWDHYSVGCGVLNIYDANRHRLSPHQRYYLVPGGSDDASPQDPQCFEQYAQSNADVAGFWTFTWFDRTGIRGIRSNGWAATFRALGRRLTKDGGAR